MKIIQSKKTITRTSPGGSETTVVTEKVTKVIERRPKK